MNYMDWFWIILPCICSSSYGSSVSSLNVTKVCEQFGDVATHVLNHSCYTYDRTKYTTWDAAADMCNNLKEKLPYGYTSRLAWFPNLDSYVDTIKSLISQSMGSYDYSWIGLRKRNETKMRYDMYWSYNAQTLVKPFNWPETHSHVTFSNPTEGCFITYDMNNVETLAKLLDYQCSYNRRYICEITSDPTPMIPYQPHSCTDHCEAMGGLRYGKSCFLLPKQNPAIPKATYPIATEYCKALGQAAVAGSVGRLAHFDEQSWNYVNTRIQSNPLVPSDMWIGLLIPTGTTEPSLISPDGYQRPPTWTLFTSLTPSSYDRYGLVRKSTQQWVTGSDGDNYWYICEIVCRTEAIGSDKVCPTLPPPVNSKSIEFTPISRIENSTVSTTCKADHHKSHYNEPKCVSDFGQLFWDDILPKCQRFTCNFDEELEQNDMVVTYKGVYPFQLGTVVSYRCDNNLRLPSGQLEIMERKCQLIPGWDFTEWAGQLMMCSKPCPVLQIEHGSVSYSDDQRRHGSRVVNVECEPGHVPFQQDSVCTDGRWLLEPVCKGIQNWLCPPGKSLDGVFYTSSSCYWITATKVNWLNSHDLCASEGGRLAAMPASDLWNYYTNTFMKNPDTTKSTFWINSRLYWGTHKEYTDANTILRTNIFLPAVTPNGFTCFLIDANKNTTDLHFCPELHNALCVRGTYYSRFQLINQQCFNTVSTQTTTESSDRACGMRCRTVDYCQSFTYHLSTKDCQLHQEKPFDFLDKMTNSSDCMTGYMIG